MKRKSARARSIEPDDCYCNLLLSCFILHALTRNDPTPPVRELVEFIRSE